MSSTSYKLFNLANTAPRRPELQKIGPDKPPHRTYCLDYKAINNASIIFIGGGCTLNPASPKRKASESDGTSHSVDLDQPYTPPNVRCVGTQYRLFLRLPKVVILIQNVLQPSNPVI